MDKNQRELFEKALQEFGDRFSLTRIKTESLDFDHDYQRGQDGQLNLVSEKAVIRCLGKTTKIKIGEGCEYPTYDAARDGAHTYWSNYFKERRNRRTDKEKAGEARRQKRYREKRRQSLVDFKRQQ